MLKLQAAPPEEAWKGVREGSWLKLVLPRPTESSRAAQCRARDPINTPNHQVSSELSTGSIATTYHPDTTLGVVRVVRE